MMTQSDEGRSREERAAEGKFMMTVDPDVLECLYLSRTICEALARVRKTDTLALVLDAARAIDFRLTEVALRRFFHVGTTAHEADEAKRVLLHESRR